MRFKQRSGSADFFRTHTIMRMEDTCNNDIVKPIYDTSNLLRLVLEIQKLGAEMDGYCSAAEGLKSGI